MHKLKGFTLIELLIVIAIISILVGIAIPRFKGMKDEGNYAKAQGEVRALRAGVESYYIHQNPSAYPLEGANWQNALTSATPRIIDTVLYDPFGSTRTTPYSYDLSSNGQYYVIYSVGINGNGSATVSDTGVVTVTNNAIWTSNSR
ncbi:MAG: type II secretion system protein [Candidatus Omnitrophica bacterium]|nr:type II secretion system protein [Candidatus Omnitrophota bacterium]